MLPQASNNNHDAPPLGGGASFFTQYFTFLMKNIAGWILLALCLVVGPIPGPGGIVLFLLGFGLISFPGKRRLIARIFRGRVFGLRGVLFHVVVAFIAAMLVMVLRWWFTMRASAPYKGLPSGPVHNQVLIFLGAWMVMGVLIHGLLRFFNWLVKVFPKGRRAIRPWLRHRGFDLLPPRIRRRVARADGTFSYSRYDTEILHIHERHTLRMKAFWTLIKPWLRRAAGVAITVAIFAWMLKPVVREWDKVGQRVKAIDWSLFVVAAGMFAAFLFVFRVVSWRKILSGFGHKLPLAPATRIWSTSELARYLPGVIWQVVGRVYLVKPYGVSGTVCSTSQILELVVFLLANVLVALSCLAFFGYRMQAYARTYLYVAMALVPLLMLLLHPKVFYTALTKYMTWRGKQLPARRVRGKTLTLLTVWAIIGLLWQSLALWLLTKGPLDLPWQKWWIIAGTYCLAWCAGFIAFWAPGGLGVREFIFVTATAYMLPNAVPPEIREKLGDPAALKGFLVFLGILLRLWTIAGELILSSIAYAMDYRGALGRPDAPGRVAAAPVEG